MRHLVKLSGRHLWAVLMLGSVLMWSGEPATGLEYELRYMWKAQAECFGGSPVLADLNLDGYLDVVSGGTAGYITAVSGITGRVLWKFGPLGVGARGPIMVEDINGDGFPEVVFGDDKDTLYCLSGPYGSEIWRVKIGRFRNAVAFFDVNNDGRKDVIAAPSAATGNLTAVDGVEGEIIWVSPATCNYYVSPRVADINADGEFEILCWGPNGMFAVNPADGSIKWQIGNAPAAGFGPVIADVNSDGVPDIIASTGGGIVAYTFDLEVLASSTTVNATWLWNATLPYNIGYISFAMGDLTGDGIYEFVHVMKQGDANTVVCRRSTDGDVLWNVTRYESEIRYSYIALGDCDNDGLPDVAIGSSQLAKPTLDILRGLDGSSILSVGMVMESGPLIGDVDGDGILEVVVNGVYRSGEQTDEVAHIWALPTTTRCEFGEIVWGSHARDQFNTGVLPIGENAAAAIVAGWLIAFLDRRHRPSRECDLPSRHLPNV